MKKRWQEILQKKSVTLALLVCLVVVATAAIYQGVTKNEKVKDQYMNVEESTKVAGVDAKVETSKEETSTAKETTKEEKTTAEEKEANSSLITKSDLHFTKDSRISWPVEGKVVMDFSMDSTIYHPTLKEYKCSPGIAIQSEEGEHVNAPCEGIVTKVGEDDEIGNYVVMAVSDNYSIKIGQLEEVKVAAGDHLKKNDPIACVSKPTSYYSVEGANVYLEVLKKNTPENPLDYLE